MNIWDPVWKEEKEDSITDSVYKLKPVQINFKSVSLPISYYKSSRVVTQKVYFDVVFKEDYINTLDVDKRKIWLLDDGGCVVKCSIDGPGINSTIAEELSNAMKGGVQRKWTATKITNGIRISVDMPRFVYQPYVTAQISSRYTYYWDFGQVKLLIPEPLRFDSSVVSIAAIFEYSHFTEMSVKGGNYKPSMCITNVDHTMDIHDYRVLNQLQFDSLSLIALHKFTIESAKNLIGEIQDIIAVPMPTRNYELSNHPEYPITYARIRNNKSIGSSYRPKEKCSIGKDPTPKIDQTQSLGRSLRNSGIVGKILSIIKRRKREIK